MNSDKTSELLRSAREVQQKAYAPYSGFRVGAALQTTSGKIYTGCNVENSSYGLTVCAEQVAVFKAVSEGESEFSAVVVCTDAEEFCTPCGACRQILLEFAPKLKIILLNSKGETKETSMADLLPEAFTKNFLKPAKSKQGE